MIKATISGERETIARLHRIPSKAHAALRGEVAALSARLQDRVKSEKLSGQALKARTGHLRDSIHVRVAEEGGRITAAISADAPYASAQEYGFHGIVSVRAYLRRTVKGNMANVRPFQRNENLPAHSFMRATLDSMAGEIRQGIHDAVLQAVKS